MKLRDRNLSVYKCSEDSLTTLWEYSHLKMETIIAYSFMWRRTRQKWASLWLISTRSLTRTNNLFPQMKTWHRSQARVRTRSFSHSKKRRARVRLSQVPSSSSTCMTQAKSASSIQTMKIWKWSASTKTCKIKSAGWATGKMEAILRYIFCDWTRQTHFQRPQISRSATLH